eukprot:5176035-Alexandrium_andersonii.AAC.1
MPRNVFVLRSQKGWNAAEVLAKHVKLIAHAGADQGLGQLRVIRRVLILVRLELGLLLGLGLGPV